MEILLAVIAITLNAHLFLLIFTNQRRIKKLVIFVNKFWDENLLAEKEYEYLYNRYANFLGYMEFFPDKEDYSILYKNREFDEFVTVTRKRLRYYAIVVAVCFVLLTVLVLGHAYAEALEQFLF